MRTAYITQVFSLARTNSDTVRNGTFCIFMTVDVSRWRGPVSPAGKISICECLGQVDSWKGIKRYYWMELTSIAGIRRRYVTCNLNGLSDDERQMTAMITHRLVHGEWVTVKSSLPATASRVLRKGWAWFWPPSTIQKISCRSKLKNKGLGW